MYGISVNYALSSLTGFREGGFLGDSMGGLIVQILLDHGYGAAGVAIDSVPPVGVRNVALSQSRAVFPVLRNPAKRHWAVGFTPQQFHYAFANTLSKEDSEKV